jgi:hypothetical protein
MNWLERNQDKVDIKDAYNKLKELRAKCRDLSKDKLAEAKKLAEARREKAPMTTPITTKPIRKRQRNILSPQWFSPSIQPRKEMKPIPSEERLQALEEENEELRRVIHRQSALFAKLEKLIDFGDDGMISLNPEAAKRFLAQGDAVGGRAKPSSNPSNNKRDHPFWADVAKRGAHEFSDKEKARILQLGATTDQPQTFYRIHVKCKGKAETRRDRQNQMVAFLKVTGLKQHIATFSFLGNILELYVCDRAMDEVIAILNNHQLTLQEDFDPLYLGDDKSSHEKRLFGLKKRIANLLARTELANLRKTIVVGIDEQVLQEILVQEESIRMKLGRNVITRNNSSTRSYAKFKPITRESIIRLQQLPSEYSSETMSELESPINSEYDSVDLSEEQGTDKEEESHPATAEEAGEQS